MKKATIALLLICTAVFAQEKGTFTDTRDKKKYQTVNLGGLTWMAENLKFNAKDSKCNGEDDEVIGDCEKGYYSDKEGCMKFKKPTAKQIQDKKKEVQARCAKEGRLYSNLQDTSNICPAGWHLPNKSELGILKDAIGNDTDEYGFKGVSNFNGGFVRCVQGKTSEEAIATAVTATVGKQFNPKIEYGSMTDARDKITYKTVKIGSQTWMAENLNYNAEGSKCYNDKDYYCKKYGRVYEWATGKTACPAGWHLPSDKEWQTLVDLAGGSNSAGKKLKAGVDDQYGFSALMSGRSQKGADMGDIGESHWWSSSEELNSGLRWPRYIGISYYTDKIENKMDPSKPLKYVRCVEGEPPKEATPPPAPAKAPAAAPAGDPSKPVYCVSYVAGKLAGCTEFKNTPQNKSNCDSQGKSMKMMLGKTEWTETKPNIKCDK